MAPLNQNIAEQFKPEGLPVGWPWRLFIFSLLVFSIVILGYLGLNFGYRPYLESKIEEMDAKISDLTSQVPLAEKEKLILIYSQFANLQKILNNRLFSSKIFPILEKITNLKIYYTVLDLKVDELKLILTGAAANYGVLSEQLAVFDVEPMIKKYNLNHSQLNDISNYVDFKVELFLSPDLLK